MWMSYLFCEAKYLPEAAFRAWKAKLGTCFTELSVNNSRKDMVSGKALWASVRLNVRFQGAEVMFRIRCGFNLQRPVLGDLLLPARLHLLKALQLSKQCQK